MMPRPPGPFLRVKKRVLAASCTLSPSERLVALALADRMNQEGRCWPGYQDIATRTGYSVSTVGRCLETLCDGEQPLVLRRSRGGGRGYIYELVSNPAKLAAAGRPWASPPTLNRSSSAPSMRISSCCGHPMPLRYA